MTSKDVRSILNLPQAGPSSQISRKQSSVAKKPEGISRELYALIGDNAPSLAEAQASLAAVKYRQRPSVKSKKVEWTWSSFTPAARRDSPVTLGHWVRTSDEDPNSRVEYFGKFSQHGPSIMEYSQFEYDQHLVDPDWTSQETAYLFDLLKTYDLRFIVAADRYAYRGPSGTNPEKRRSVEEIKDRYYTICRRLVRTRTATDPQSQQQLIHAYSFDKEREIKRKQYASELFHLTAAEIAEEEALYVEIKRMEQNERRYRADRDDLMRTVMGLDSGLLDFDLNGAEAIFGVDKNKKRKRAEEGEPPVVSPVAPAKKPKESAAFDLAHCIYRVPPPPINSQTSHLASKHPIHQPVQLRSTKLPLPKPTATARITELLNELGISVHRLVMPTRANIDMFDNLLQASGALVDMKRQVDRVEQELRTVRAQKEGLLPTVIDVASRKNRSESITSTDTQQTGRRSRPP